MSHVRVRELAHTFSSTWNLRAVGVFVQGRGNKLDGAVANSERYHDAKEVRRTFLRVPFSRVASRHSFD